MSKPKLLDAYTKESKTITAVQSDYAVVVRWTDGNPDKEDRIGYFVSNNSEKNGMSIEKATEFSKVLGITVDAPGFATNVRKDNCDECGLLPEYSYVCFAGFATVIDNGTCAVNTVCKPSQSGTAVPSNDGCGYKVIDRVDESHVLIHVNPLLQMEVKKGTLIVSY